MSNINILLIEDNQNDVELVKQALMHEQGKYAMDVATTLRQGMNLLEAHKYDVVLLDLLLPDSNPVSILAPLITIMSNHPGEYPTVVVLTGLDDRDIKLEALRMGAQGYHSKNSLEPDSEELWVCLNDASVRGAYIRSLIHEGLPFRSVPTRVLSNAQRLIDDLLVGASNSEGGSSE
jgi:DNA-binding NarL/FixJ family response regulator